MVITVSKEEFAERIGVIRRKQDSIFYVEPKEVVKLGNDLLGIQEEIDAQTSFISNHMNAAISRAAGRIDHGLDAVARIDTIFARAAFGSTLNGCIPEIGDSGVIDVEDFIHPVLAASKRRRTVPIDLKIASKDLGERTLIISGPNGKSSKIVSTVDNQIFTL